MSIDGTVTRIPDDRRPTSDLDFSDRSHGLFQAHGALWSGTRERPPSTSSSAAIRGAPGEGRWSALVEEGEEAFGEQIRVAGPAGGQVVGVFDDEGRPVVGHGCPGGREGAALDDPSLFPRGPATTTRATMTDDRAVVRGPRWNSDGSSSAALTSSCTYCG